MEEKKGFFTEFKEFILRGNVMDLAVGVIIGGAFGTIISSLVEDIIMPVISLATGGVSFEDWFVALDGGTYPTLAAAQEAGASTLNYGKFISTIFYFIIIALCIFLMVRAINKLHKKTEEAVVTKECPFCKTEIPLEATRCPHCTSELEASAE